MGLTLLSSAAWAVPGPDSVAVVANGNDLESVALAQLYLQARQIPSAQLCVLDLPSEHTIDLATYRDRLDGPLEDCLSEQGVLDRIEALVLVQGVPLRVTISAEGRNERASVAAALGMWRTVTASSGASFLDRTPGTDLNCGQNRTCRGARWRNPYTSGAFEAGYTASNQGLEYHPMLVTALMARSYADAAKLIASATTAEALGGAQGEFLFMDGADPARGVLDSNYPLVIRQLEDRGFTDIDRVPFDRDLTGRTLASFFVGTAALGDTIEGNTFLPGALVDNLTSFGAVPQNFQAPEDQRQVSIARWVAKGVAGVHGTTDEPLNNCFPNRRLLVDYVDGWTLAESYHRNLPFVYWRNLVLGDPITAPYAARPIIQLEGLSEDQTVEGSAQVRVVVDLNSVPVIAHLALYVDGEELIHEPGGLGIDTCLAFEEPGEHQVLAVIQSAREPFSKGWASVTVQSTPGRTDCSAPDAGVIDLGFPDQGIDAGARDAGVSSDSGASDQGTADLGVAPEPEGGCRCVPPSATPRWSFALLGLALWGVRSKRRKQRDRSQATS